MSSLFSKVLFYEQVYVRIRVIPLSLRPAIRLSVWTTKRLAKLNHLLKRQGGYSEAEVNIICFVSWVSWVCELSMLHIHRSFYIFVFLFQKI
jgi:hypothetical protein